VTRYLLDTHAFFWFVFDSPQLSAEARRLLEDPDNELFVSTASIWESAIKVRLGKLSLQPDVVAFFEDEARDSKMSILLVEPKHIQPLSSLPLHHRDPFDRLMISQCLVEGMALISSDSSLGGYEDVGLKVCW
jgi:PIN domain nuclease of toxin-antitoxin system